MKNKTFRKIVATKTYVFPNSGPRNTNRKLRNLNKLLFTYPGVIGVKTGYTTKGRNTYIGIAERDGKTVIINFHASPLRSRCISKEVIRLGI